MYTEWGVLTLLGHVEGEQDKSNNTCSASWESSESAQCLLRYQDRIVRERKPSFLFHKNHPKVSVDSLHTGRSEDPAQSILMLLMESIIFSRPAMLSRTLTYTSPRRMDRHGRLGENLVKRNYGVLEVIGNRKYGVQMSLGSMKLL